MSWGRYDDRAPFHRKFLGLSNDATALHWRANQWARSPEATKAKGFLTERQLFALRGDISGKRFKVVLDELLETGVPVHEEGLLEKVEHGYLIHDFDDYGPAQGTPGGGPAGAPAATAPGRSDAARRAGLASAAARRDRSGSAQPVRTQLRTEPPNGAERPARTEPNATPNAGAERPRTSSDLTCQISSGSPDPEPDQPENTNQRPDRLELERPRTEAGDSSNERIPCPSDLQLTTDQRGTLVNGGIEDWGIDPLTLKFKASHQGDPNDRRTLIAWRKCLSQAICSWWHDKRHRPPRPEEEAKERAPQPEWQDEDFDTEAPLVCPDDLRPKRPGVRSAGGLTSDSQAREGSGS